VLFNVRATRNTLPSIHAPSPPSLKLKRKIRKLAGENVPPDCVWNAVDFRDVMYEAVLDPAKDMPLINESLKELMCVSKAPAIRFYYLDRFSHVFSGSTTTTLRLRLFPGVFMTCSGAFAFTMRFPGVFLASSSPRFFGGRPLLAGVTGLA